MINKRMGSILLISLLLLMLLAGCASADENRNEAEQAVNPDNSFPQTDNKLESSGKTDNMQAEEEVIPESLPYGIKESYASPGQELHFYGYAENTEFTITINDQKSDKIRTFSTKEPWFLPEENDMESFLMVEAEGYEAVKMFMSTLPVVYLECPKKYLNIGELSESVYFKLQPSALLNEETLDEKCFYDGEAEIHLRGNSTKYRQKRPFKLKLDKKTDLLGLTPKKNKHYVLLAQDIDHTLIRNKLLMDLSGAMGTPVSMNSENVSLIYNGEYYGVYLLSEHVRVAEGRVDVFDWDDTYTDEEGKEYPLWWRADASELTGGFLLEMDFYAFEENEQANLITAYKQPLYFNTPEPNLVKLPIFKKNPLYTNTRAYIQSFEYALHSDDFFFRNSDKHYVAQISQRGWKQEIKYKEVDYEDDQHNGMHYSELFDMDSLVDNFLFCEFAMNWDSMKNSVFVYKDIEGPAFIGPQWDFDWALGNINMYGINTWYPESWHTTERAFTVEQYYQTVQWNRMLIRDPYFLTLAYEKWKSIRPTVIEDIVKEGGTIDQYRDAYRLAGAANDQRWGEFYNDPSSYYGANSKDYRGSYDSLKLFVKKRMNWMDRQFESLEGFISSLGTYHPSELLCVSVENMQSEYVADIDVLNAVYGADNSERTEEDTGDIHGINIQINGTFLYTLMFDELSSGKLTVSSAGTTEEGGLRLTVALPKEALAEVGKINCIEVKALDMNGNYLIDSKRSETGNYNLTISNYTSFTTE